MEGEVRRRVTDLVLWIFRIVPTEEGPCPLPPLAMNVLGPQGAFGSSARMVTPGLSVRREKDVVRP